MTRPEFNKLQYDTLREEIRESKARMHRTLLYGLSVAPAASTLAQVMKIDVLILLVPLFVLTIGLLYLSDSYSVMRCGTFIKNHLEASIPGGKGWEQWLYGDGRLHQRSVDIFLLGGFYVLFVVYYVAATYMAIVFAGEKYGGGTRTLLTGGYGLIGAAFVVFLVINFRSCIQTGELQADPKAGANPTADPSPHSSTRD